ncbi:Ku protein [Streptomyces sp. YS-3]|uniref:Ku protein n=1 Tax=Streptomyces sp. YS-3 TaxID=3381352 RepID=UPI0038625B9E
MLRQALERSAKVAVAKAAWRNRERLGLLRVKEDAIVLHAMCWDDEIRDPPNVTVPAVDVSAAEGQAPAAGMIAGIGLEAALQLLETMAQEDISDYRDHCRDAVEEMFAAKSEQARRARRTAADRRGRRPDGSPERLRRSCEGPPRRVQ